MTGAIIGAVLAGIACGYFFVPETLLLYIGPAVTGLLCLILFVVGLDIGRQGSVLADIRKTGFRILFVPAMIIVGTLGGSALAGLVLQTPVKEAAAIGAGFGWYSLSAIILADYSPVLGATSFLANVFREIIGIILIPLVASRIGFLEAIAPPGVASMDTCLPIIERATDEQIVIYSFVSGVLITMLVPIMIPYIMAL